MSYYEINGKKKWINDDPLKWAGYGEDYSYEIVREAIKSEGNNIDFRYNSLTDPNSMLQWDTSFQGRDFWGICNADFTPLKVDNLVYLSIKGDDDPITETKYYFLKFFGQHCSPSSIYIHNTSSKYTEYEYEDGTFYGCVEGKRTALKMYKFLTNRGLPDEVAQEFIRNLNKDKEYTWKYKDLVEGYNETTIHSCMQGEGGYFESLQNKLGDNVRLLCCYEDYREIGRAIVWDSSIINGIMPDGCVGIMDRIYPSDNHKIVNLFKQYASKNNLMHKLVQNYEDSNAQKFIWNGMSHNVGLYIKVGDLRDAQTPYMDTFRWYTMEGSLHNYDECGSIKLTNTDGGVLVDMNTCDRCGRLISDDDTYHTSNNCYCRECAEEHTFYCEYCNSTCGIDDIIETEDGSICQDCADRRYRYSECRDMYIRESNAVWCEYDDDYCHIVDDYCYSDYSEQYSYSQSLVEVYTSNRDNQYWFEEEAQQYAYWYNDRWNVEEQEEGDEDESA